MKKTFGILLLILCIISVVAVSGCSGSTETSSSSPAVEDDLRMDALRINNSCKTFYAGIISGAVNETDDGDKITETLPDKNMSILDRQEAAKKLTVRSALEKSGLERFLDEKVISDFVYDQDHNIYYKSDIDPAKIKGTLSLDTKLGDIIG